MRIYARSAQDALHSYVSIWNKGKWYFLGTFILVEFMNQYFTNIEKLFGITALNDPTLLIISQLGSLTTTIFGDAVMMMAVPFFFLYQPEKVDSVSFCFFLKKHMGPLCIEFMRVIAKIILWGLLFILPGLYKQIRYYFVPYVVLFLPEYQEDKVDALEVSEWLTKGHGWGIFILVLFLTSAELSLAHWKSTLSLLESPFQLLLTVAVILIYDVFIFSWLYFLYRRLLEEKQSAQEAE